MRLRSLLLCGVIGCSILLGTAARASAQNAKRLGLAIAYPATAGLQWQVNDRITIRGDAAFTVNRLEQTSSTLAGGGSGGGSAIVSTTQSSSHSTAVGFATLVTVSRHEQLRLYLAPRVAWNVVGTTFTTDTVITSSAGGGSSSVSTRATSTTRNGAQIDAMFGANYRLGERFSIYGEGGVGFTWPTATSSSESDRIKSFSVGSRSNVGIVIHF